MGLYICVLVFMLVLALLLVYGMVGFIRNSFPSLTPLRLLRVVGTLAAGILYIPLLEVVRAHCWCQHVVSALPAAPPAALHPPPHHNCSCCTASSAGRRRRASGATAARTAAPPPL